MSTVSAGEFIRARRKEKAISLTELAEMIGVTKSYQSLIESDKRTASDDQILSLSRVLDLPPDLLRVASGRVPADVQNASSLTPEIVSFAREKIQQRATSSSIPEDLSSRMKGVLEQACKGRAHLAEGKYQGELRFGKNTNSYRTHSYHTKVPPELITPIIEHFTEPGAVVLDPFCGSGMTGVAALRCGRHAVLSDISPAAVHISHNYVTGCDPIRLRNALTQLSERLAPTMAWLYDVAGHNGNVSTVEYTTWSDRFQCPHCDASFTYWDAARGDDGTIIGEAFPCPNCSNDLSKRNLRWVGEEPVESNTSSSVIKGRDIHKPTAAESRLISESDRWPIPYFVPHVPFEETREMWRASHTVMGIDSVAGFYTKRNLHALAALRHEIMQEPDQRLRAALMFGFTAIVNRASKRYQWNAKRPTNVMTGTLYVSSLRYEWNVWSLFFRKMGDVIRYYESFPTVNDARAEALLGSATCLSGIPDASVDLVFMDPPFGSNIFYSDVSLLWEAWLGKLTDDTEEMVVSKRRASSSRGKTLRDYSDLLCCAFKEAKRVLKPDARAILFFSNTNGEVWEALQNAITGAGLEIESTGVVDKVHRSIKGVQADLGKENVTRLDLMLTLKCSQPQRSRKEKLRAQPLKDEVRLEIKAHLESVGADGATIDEVHSHLLRVFLSKQISVRDISLEVVRELCNGLGQRCEANRWCLDDNREGEEAIVKIDSPFGCSVLDYIDRSYCPPEAQLSRRPKRVSIPDVDSVSGTRNSSYYNAHSYPTKVPPEAIIPYIEHFTRRGDVVLDPFSGSGMTGVAASLTGRRAILNDISVTASHLGFNHTRPCDPQDLRETFEDLYARLLPEFHEMYCHRDSSGAAGYAHYTLWSKRLRCNECDSTFLLWDAIDQSTGRMGKSVDCPECSASVRRTNLAAEHFEPVVADCTFVEGTKKNRRLIRLAEPERELLTTSTFRDVTHWFPHVPLGPDRDMYNLSALHLQDIHEVADFYTPRNLKALSLLWDSVQQTKDGRLRHALEFAFTNTAWHGTKMRRFNARGGQRPLTGTLFVPQLSSEVNVLEVMKNKVRHLIKYYSEYKPSKSVELPSIRVGSATLLSGVSSESVDYIFTDPPFGSNIFYADCNLLFEAWLGGITHTKKEAVVNRTIGKEAGGKTIVEYQELMSAAFVEMARVLKPRAWATLVFHNTDSEVWRAIQAAAVSAGFSLEHAAELNRQQQSHKGYKGRSGEENVAHFDVIMSMRKQPPSAKIRQRPLADGDSVRHIVTELVAENGKKALSVQWVHSAVLRRLVVDGFDLGSVSFASIKDVLESVKQSATV